MSAITGQISASHLLNGGIYPAYSGVNYSSAQTGPWVSMTGGAEFRPPPRRSRALRQTIDFQIVHPVEEREESEFAETYSRGGRRVPVQTPGRVGSILNARA